MENGIEIKDKSSSQTEWILCLIFW